MSENLVETFHKMGFKATPQRIAILQALQEDRTHPSAEQVYRVVKEKHPTITLATVYKTLEALLKAGVISQLGYYEGRMRFDANPKPHVNLICTNCGRIEDLKMTVLDEVIERVRVETGYKVDGSLVEVYGTCGECQSGVHGG